MPMDLAEYIHKDAGHVPNMKFIAKVALDIARGLEYLHSHNVGHKHLKSRNIFLTENLGAKISDYGLSKIKLESSSNGAAAGEATVRWRATETFTREYAKVKDDPEEQKQADIYSFGVLLWDAGKKPFNNKSESQVVKALEVAQREHMDATWPPILKELITQCRAFVPASRPTICSNYL